jgi:serine/threonine-protein kinase
MRVIDQAGWRALEPLLDRALDLGDGERAAWLAQLRVESPNTADQLSAILSGEGAADRVGFLSEPLEMTLEGLEVGGYTLERRLGQGGMGSVWLARRTDGRFEGCAAVKLMNLALLTNEGQARFRLEGSVLARLTHPGIARLLDAGVAPGGQPYLVIEHVDGVRLDEYVVRHGLSIDERVRLVVQVLAAVGHAHANLIVHRVLKATNILVTADGRVKLLDFGIAKLLDHPDAARNEVTADGRALTPESAAPEQVRGGAITTATDVYAVGVLLYTLLTGRRPYEVQGRSAADMERLICDAEPVRPSSVPPNESSGRDRRPLRGDLDAIVLKALAKEPERRYPSATAFADDLQRHLEGRPVLARPNGATYRLMKFARRHRLSLAAALAMAMLTTTYLLTVLRDREHIRRALAEATIGTQKAEQMTDFAVGLFEASDRGRAVGDTIKAHDLIERGLAQARELSGQPLLEAQMLDVIGRIQSEIGAYNEARPVLEQALALRLKRLGERHPDVATSQVSLGQLYNSLQMDRQAIVLFGSALVTRRALFGEMDVRTTDVMYQLATSLHMSGDYRGARPLLDEWMRAVARQPAQVSPIRAERLADLASIMQMIGQTASAEQFAREGLTTDRALYGDRHPRVALDMMRLGRVLDELKRYDEADTLQRMAIVIMRARYPDGHPDLANALRDYALHLQDVGGRWEEADSLWREAIPIYSRFVGDHSMAVASSMLWLGSSLTARGRFGEAVPILRRAVQLHMETARASSAVIARARVYLADALRGQGHLAEAEHMLLSAYRQLQAETRFSRAARRVAIPALVRLYEAKGDSGLVEKYRALGY